MRKGIRPGEEEPVGIFNALLTHTTKWDPTYKCSHCVYYLALIQAYYTLLPMKEKLRRVLFGNCRYNEIGTAPPGDAQSGYTPNSLLRKSSFAEDFPYQSVELKKLLGSVVKVFNDYLTIPVALHLFIVD
uniref:Uncharacterized protein n=1 Tax=Xenopus tropicalis TaxID=8364 RepID=A0A1B8Y0C4_XENTR